MSNLCLKYYVLIKNNSLDYANILERIRERDNDLMNLIVTHDFINCEVQDLIDQFPKFLSYSENILKLEDAKPNYDQNKIYNATSMSYESLLESINRDKLVRSTNRQIKYIPESYKNQIKEHKFQTNYIDGFDENFFSENLFISNYENIDYVNSFSSLLDSEYDDTIVDRKTKGTLERNSFLHLYFFNILTNYFLKKYSNLKRNMSIRISDLDLPMISSINILNHFEKITHTVLINQFSFVNIDDNFKAKMLNDISLKNSVREVANGFNNYVRKNLATIKREITNLCFETLNHNHCFEFVSNHFAKERYIRLDKLNKAVYTTFESQSSTFLSTLYLPDIDSQRNTLNDFENKISDYHISTLNDGSAIRNYFYLLYLYRNKIRKFINQINIVADHYIQNNIRFEDIYYFNNFNHMIRIFKDWSSCLRYAAYSSELQKMSSGDKYLETFNKNDKIAEFALVYVLYKYIREFVETDSFKDQVNSIHNNIYRYLRKNGIVDDVIDWCSCSKPTEIYLTFVLRRLVDELDPTFLKEYTRTQINQSDYDYFRNEQEYNDFCNNFADSHGYYIFEFYKRFLKSYMSKVFARSVHLMYALSMKRNVVKFFLNVGRWRVEDFGGWRNSNTSVDLFDGTYNIFFEPVEGYLTPSHLSIHLKDGMNIERKITYKIQ